MNNYNDNDIEFNELKEHFDRILGEIQFQSFRLHTISRKKPEYVILGSETMRKLQEYILHPKSEFSNERGIYDYQRLLMTNFNLSAIVDVTHFAVVPKDFVQVVYPSIFN